MPSCKATISGLLFHWYHCVKALLAPLGLPTLHDQLAASTLVRTDISTRAAVVRAWGKLSGCAFFSILQLNWQTANVVRFAIMDMTQHVVCSIDELVHEQCLVPDAS